MTDELDDLKAAFDAATPEPDAARKRENIALAEKTFADRQGAAKGARPTVQKGPMGRFLDGVGTMINVLTTRAGLTATTAIVAVGMLAVLPNMPFAPELQRPNFELSEVPADVLISPKSGTEAWTEGTGEDVWLEQEQTTPSLQAAPTESDRIVVDDAVRTPPAALPVEELADTPEAERQTQAKPRRRLPAGKNVRMGISNGGDADVNFNSRIRISPSVSAETDGGLAFGGSVRADNSSGNSSETAGQVFIEGTFGKVTMGDLNGAPEAAVGDMSGVAVGVEDRLIQSELIAPIDAPVVIPEADTEAFANEPASDIKVVTEEPVSTFSIDVDTAAYAVVRSSLMAGVLPPKGAVRVEEMVNYFNYDYAAPEGPHPFQPTVTVVPSPWNAGTNLVHIGIQGTLPALDDRPPLNLVFLIDTSGSMQDANKLPLLKQSFRLMLSELRPEDEVSIVTYAGSAGQVLEPTRAAERSTILDALDRLAAGGSTAGQAGLQQAYQVAEGMAGDGEVTRVILATDGDFNVGLSNPDALKDFIAEKRDSGTYLSVLGFGRGNLDDATMQALAQNGNGQAAYIDTLAEARKVLVDQLTGALFPIANDVKIQVEFNPAEIAEYRLIGYETRALAREDFNNDRVDAGDIGAGHRVTAVYEVTPVGSDAIRNGPLRYSEADVAAASTASDEYGFFKLRYKRPGEDVSTLIEQPIMAGQGMASEDVRFSIAMAGFGQLLRGGDYLGAWGWSDAIDLATGARGEDAFGYRAEAVTLMRLAETLSR